MKTINKNFPSWKLLLTFLVITIAILISISGFFINSSFSALYLGAVFLLFPIFWLWIKKPVFSLYLIVFISLLPYGLIPTAIFDYLYKALAIIAPIIWLFYVIRRHEKVIFSIPTLLMLAFLLWSAVTLLWNTNINIGVSFLQIYLVRVLVFLFLVPNLIRTEKSLNGFMNTLALSGWVLVIASIITIISTGYTPGMRLKVFGENENGIGILALVSMVGVAWKALQPNKRRMLLWKVLAFSYLFATIAITAVSGSRGSAISLLVTFLAFWIWKPTRILGKVSFVYLIMIAMMVPLIYKTVIDRFTLIDQANTLLGGREALWSAAWLYIRDNPWFGVGLGNSNYVMLSYLQLFRSTLDIDFAPVHNPFLTIWMETGIPGLIFYFGSLISAIFIFIQQYVRGNKYFEGKIIAYYGIVASVFLGYMLSWIKGGGEESSYSYFLMLALLVLPVNIIISHTSDYS